jgi:hypothetical protein
MMPSSSTMEFASCAPAGCASWRSGTWRAAFVSRLSNRHTDVDWQRRSALIPQIRIQTPSFSTATLTRSDAALAVVSALPSWGWVGVLRLIPRVLRDGVYTLIARNRYHLFGRHAVCDLGGLSFADRIIVETSLVSHHQYPKG